MKKLIITTLVIALCSVAVSAYTVIENKKLTVVLQELKQQSNFKNSLNENKQILNQYIETAIDNYIEKERQANIKLKYMGYDNAAETAFDSNKRIYGSEKARYTMVEFSDTECPYCKKFHDTPKQVVDASNGLINWEWKHMPLGFHNPSALKQAVASECANELGGNKAFWVYMHSIFDETKGNGQGVKSITDVAYGIGLDVEKFNTCLSDKKHLEKVQDDLKQAKSLGVNSTPVTYIVDNKTGRKVIMKGMVKPIALVSAIQKLKKEGEEASLSNRSSKKGKEG